MLDNILPNIENQLVASIIDGQFHHGAENLVTSTPAWSIVRLDDFPNIVIVQAHFEFRFYDTASQKIAGSAFIRGLRNGNADSFNR